MKLFRAACCLLLAAWAGLAQDDSEALGEIRGQAVSAHSGKALPGVQVSLRSAQTGPSLNQLSREAHSGFDGRYAFADLAPGEYILRIAKSGYEGDQQVSRQVEVSELDPVTKLDLQLRPSASIAGRVLDSDGDPLPDTPVVLYHWESTMGRSVLRYVRSSHSDDRGLYRLWGLLPNDYVLAALPTALPAARGRWVQEMSPAFYPSALGPRGGSVLKVRWGQHLEGVDLRVEAAKETSLEGVVVEAPAGVACVDCRLNVLSPAGAMLGAIGVESNGAFSLRGFPSGRYLIVAENRRRLRGTAEVTLVRGKETLLRLEVGESSAVAGRVIAEDVPLDPSAPVDAASTVNVQLSGDPVENGRFRRATRPAPGEGGRFLLEAVPPGRYLLSILRGGGGAAGYLRGAMLGGRPLSGPEIEVPPGRTLEGLEVRVGFDGGQLNGRAVADELPPQGVVVALPDDYGEGFSFGHLGAFRGGDGLFEIPNLPPGRYRLFAVARNNRFDLGNPRTRQFLRHEGKRVQVSPNETATIDVPFIADPD